MDWLLCLTRGLMVKSSKITLMRIDIDRHWRDLCTQLVLTNTHTRAHTWASRTNCENNKSNSADVIKPSVYQFVMAQRHTHTHTQPQTHNYTHIHQSWILFIMMSISMSDRKVKRGEQLHRSPEVWQNASEVYGYHTSGPSSTKGQLQRRRGDLLHCCIFTSDAVMMDYKAHSGRQDGSSSFQSQSCVYTLLG